MNLLRLVPLCVAAGSIAACAAPAAPEVADTTKVAEACMQTTGSNICRKPGSGNTSKVESVSGEDLRRSGGPMTGQTPGKTGN